MSSSSLVQRDDDGDGAVTYEFDLVEGGKAGKQWIACEAATAVAVWKSWEFPNQPDATEFFSRMQPTVESLCINPPNTETEFEGPHPTLEIRKPGGEIEKILRSRPIAEIRCINGGRAHSLTLRKHEDWEQEIGDRRYWSVEQSTDLPK